MAGARAGSGGPGAEVAGEDGAGRPIDAALVLGDLAGTRASGPLVASFSDSAGSAPGLLQSTVAAAIAQQTGVMSDAPGTLAALAHLVFPLAGGEQGPLGARGLPAVLVGAGGELPPPAGEPVSTARLEALGRATLTAVYALDGGPEIGGGEAGRGLETGLPIQQKAIPAWALRLLVAALLLPALAVLGDGFARLRRRRVPIGRWVVWALACALPFLACAAFATLLGSLGVIPAPSPPVSSAALPFDGHALEAVLASALVLVLAWLAWPALMRRIGLPVHPYDAATRRFPVRPHDAAARRFPVRPHTDAAALGMLLVLGGLTVVVWVSDPLTALLLMPALNLWLVLAARADWRVAARAGSAASGGRIQALVLVALGVVPLALLVAFYAHQLTWGSEACRTPPCCCSPAGASGWRARCCGASPSAVSPRRCWSRSPRAASTRTMPASRTSGPATASRSRSAGRCPMLGPGRWVAPSPRCDGETTSLGVAAPGSLVSDRLR